MRFRTKDIGEEGVEVHVPIEAQWLQGVCPDAPFEPAAAGLRVDGRLERNLDGFLLRADLRGTVQMTCVRCLETAQLPLDVPIVLAYVEHDPRARDTDEDEGDGEDVVVVDDGVIDLGLAVRDEIMLALPIGPVCREDCAGICPECGRNRNRESCDCEQKQRQAASALGRALSRIKI